MTGQDVPAGWYDDGHGSQRWFDGTVWTETVVPGDPAPVRPAAKEPAPATPPTVPPPPYVPPAEAEQPPGGGEVATVAADTTQPAEPERGRRRGRRGWAVAAAAVILVSAAGLTYSALGDPGTGTVASPDGRSATGLTTSTASTGSATSAGGAAATSAPLTDGDWRVESYQLRANEDDEFAGSARITYTGSDPTGGQASFTFTVAKDGAPVARLVASVLDARPGTTTTAQLASTDRFAVGPYSAVSFQKDF